MTTVFGPNRTKVGISTASGTTPQSNGVDRIQPRHLPARTTAIPTAVMPSANSGR